MTTLLPDTACQANCPASRVDLEASGCLVAPPVFKTGERCAVALAGSIPVRLRDALARRAHPRAGLGRASPGRAAPAASSFPPAPGAAIPQPCPMLGTLPRDH